MDESSFESWAMLTSMLGLYYLEVIRLLKSGVESMGGYTNKNIYLLEREIKNLNGEAITHAPNHITTLIFEGDITFAQGATFYYFY